MILYSKINFAHVIKLRFLKLGAYPELSLSMVMEHNLEASISNCLYFILLFFFPLRNINNYTNLCTILVEIFFNWLVLAL